MKYKYTYDEWSQDTRTWEIESDKQLTEEEIIDIALNTEMDEKKPYQAKDFVCKFKGTEWGDDSQFEITGDTK
jgi:hypothetical protein